MSRKQEARKEIGIWIRVSTEDQAQGESPEHHEKRARYYAEAKGWKVTEVYHLEGVSGKAVMAHPEAARMLDDIKSGHITGLIFSKLARLARNTRELLDFADVFREHDADLISLHEAIDTTSPAGRLFYTMIAAMAQWEREEIAERVRASVPVRAKLGKPLGGQAVYGYQWKDDKLIPDPDEAPVRKLIYELFAEHKRKKTVARILNEQGYRTRKGAKFSDTTITRLLKDRTAKGERLVNYTRTSDRNKAWELKPEEDWIIHPVEPIVSDELWKECNTILDEQVRKNKRPARKTVQLFAGLTFCECGGKMYVPSNTPKYTCMTCRKKIPIVDLEAIFHEQLKAFVFSPEEIAEAVSEVDSTLKEKERLIGVLEKEQKSLIKEMDKVYDLYMDDQLSKADFGERYHPLKDRSRQIEKEIPRLEAERDVMRIQYLSRDQVLNDAQDLFSRWEGLSQEDKRSIVEAIVERITVGDGEVAIDLFYAPQDDGKKATRPQGFIAAIS